MKLSERIREEISKSGLVRWDELADEVAELEKSTADPERLQTQYILGMHNIFSMCRANSVDMETTRFVIGMYNEYFNGTE